MTKRDLVIVARGIAPVLREFMSQIIERCAALELKERGLDGPAGPPGPPGRDGRDGLPGWIGEKGKDGTNGIDGNDGMGFDDIHVTHDGERGFSFKFIRGEQVKEFGTFIVPCQIHRGVWQAKAYAYQDVVTWAGSQWVCMSPTTTSKPGDGGSGWLLVVKRGADGKGIKGEKGDPGPTGKPGRGYME